VQVQCWLREHTVLVVYALTRLHNPCWSEQNGMGPFFMNSEAKFLFFKILYSGAPAFCRLRCIHIPVNRHPELFNFHTYIYWILERPSSSVQDFCGCLGTMHYSCWVDAVCAQRKASVYARIGCNAQKNTK